ncbi:MAG: hypothetical protein RL015_652 [Verrucomicrobiota bacterium]|jgi:hypothetical protein
MADLGGLLEFWHCGCLLKLGDCFLDFTFTLEILAQQNE